MDSSEFSGGRDEININRRRANAVRDFEDDHDRARDDLLFEIRNAIHDAPDDPCAAVRAVERVLEDQDWVFKRGFRAFRREFAP